VDEVDVGLHVLVQVSLMAVQLLELLLRVALCDVIEREQLEEFLSREISEENFSGIAKKDSFC